MRPAARATAWTLSLFLSLAGNASQAADLVWEVESPFRFFKSTQEFAAQIAGDSDKWAAVIALTGVKVD